MTQAIVFSSRWKKGTRPDEVTNKVLDKLKKSGSMRQQGSYRSFDTAILSKGIGKVLSTITYFITARGGYFAVYRGCWCDEYDVYFSF